MMVHFSSLPLGGDAAIVHSSSLPQVRPASNHVLRPVSHSHPSQLPLDHWAQVLYGDTVPYHLQDSVVSQPPSVCRILLHRVALSLRQLCQSGETANQPTTVVQTFAARPCCSRPV
jgi:hypothetical protein